MSPSVEVRVHEGDDARIERILDLIDEAARPRPIDEVLGVLCGEVAAICDAPIASLYTRDDDDDDVLVMQANVGFPGEAIGTVKLAVGEGITGFAAECMRPVTVSVAGDDERFKPVPGLGEEEYPIFLALPILVGRRAEAVLVLQREGGHPFSDDEVVLATALSTSFAYALERARSPEDRQDTEVRAPRKARLAGRALAPGIALGRVETVPTFRGLAALARSRRLDEPQEPEVARLRMRAAIEQVGRELRRAAERLELAPASRAQLESLLLVPEDQRLGELFDEAAVQHPNPVSALESVARTVARAPYDVGADRSADRSSTRRAAEVEVLCLHVAARMLDLRLPTQGAALLLTDRLPALTALGAAAHRASGLAVSAALLEDDLGVELARAAKLPLVDRVGGLFAWAHVGDRVIVDADEGVVRVNPSAATLARFRRER